MHLVTACVLARRGEALKIRGDVVSRPGIGIPVGVNAVGRRHGRSSSLLWAMVAVVEALVTPQDRMTLAVTELIALIARVVVVVGEMVLRTTTTAWTTATAPTTVTATTTTTGGSISGSWETSAITAILLQIKALFEGDKLGLKITQTDWIDPSSEATNGGVVLCIKAG